MPKRYKSPRNEKPTVPQDRTLRQAVEGYCANPDCRENGQDFRFVVNHDRFSCPKCGADRGPMVGVLVLTHLLIPDKTGPINGSGGRRFRIGCHSRRAYLATVTNLEAATDQPNVCNCPGCLAEAKRLNLIRPQGEALQLEVSK